MVLKDPRGQGLSLRTTTQTTSQVHATPKSTIKLIFLKLIPEIKSNVQCVATASKNPNYEGLATEIKRQTGVKYGNN